MRPVSGEDLVTAALRSSLARAQKNYVKFSNPKQKQEGSREIGKALKLIKREGIGKVKGLQFQTEFDLWREQASAFTFTTEGYTNGAAVPEGIECLNASSSFSSTNKSVKKERTVNRKDVVGENCLKNSEAKGGGEEVNSSDQSGKDALNSENSFEILRKLKENRKGKKKLVKLRKKLLKKGCSVEEIDKLIRVAKSTNFSDGAIFQKLKDAIPVDEEESRGSDKKQLVGKNQLKNQKSPSSKMKDMLENGSARPSAAATSTVGQRPNTPTSPAQPHSLGGCSSTSSSPVANGGSNSQQHQLPLPKRTLYPREKIIPGYIDDLPVGAGFFNLGNSCYLNASLQAVFHVPAFINWLRSDTEHKRHCQDNVSCIVCAMKKTFESATSRGSIHSAIRPVEIINRLRSICRHFSHGRQEDAHEFLRYLFESMEKSYLAAINCLRIDNRSKETNPLGQIFGGYLRTEVTCLKCHYVSTTFQPTAELQLDIRHHTSLDDAIQNHFKKERLDNNDYKCEKCRTISQATKQFSLEVPPIVLCLQLKRFTLYGTKIAKRIHCNRILDMSKYMHKSKQVNGFTNLRYRLAALVTHLGSSPNCGHYTAIAQAADGNYYQFDDSFVHHVTTATALNNDAYVIIYEMESKPKKTPESTAKSTTAEGTGFTSNLAGLGSSSSGNSSSSNYQLSSSNSLFPKKLPSTPIPKVSTPQTSKLVKQQENQTSINGNGRVSSNTNGCLKPESERKLISFGIGVRTPINATNKINVLKEGVRLTNSSKLGGSNNSTSTQSSLGHRKLVPYNDDENDESDKDEQVRGESSPGKRLNSPENRSKQSPKRSSNDTSANIPPKTSKQSNGNSNGLTSSSSMLGISPKKEKEQDHKPEKSPQLDSFSKSPEAKTVLESHKEKDSNKRKNSEEKELNSRKPRTHKRRSSSSSSSSSSRSQSNSSDRGKNCQNKRKREDEASPRSSSEKKPSSHHSSSESSSSKRDKERDHRNSQERERERRKNRNPSPNSEPDHAKSRSRSPSASGNDKRPSTNEAAAGTSSSVSDETSFDVSRVSQNNSILSWNGQRSTLCRSLEDDRKRANEKTQDEEYDEEFDQGRTKKVRRSKSLPRETERCGENRFQSVEDRKKQVEQWGKLLNGYKDKRSNNSSDSRSWANDEDSRTNRSFSRSNSNSNGFRPRHSSSNSYSNSNSNYARNNSHGRSPFKNGHHCGNGSNHYRSQSQNSHHYNNGNKHWSGDRNRH